MKKYIVPVILLVVVVTGIILYTSFNPETSALFPSCPFHKLTGYQCPGCGMQRALHEILHGNFKTAFLYNPLPFILFPYILLGLYLVLSKESVRRNKIKNVLYGKVAAIIMICGVLLFWVLRNM